MHLTLVHQAVLMVNHSICTIRKKSFIIALKIYSILNRPDNRTIQPINNQCRHLLVGNYFRCTLTSSCLIIFLTLSVKVEVHSSSSGAASDENLSSSDMSERSGDHEHDYEDIYLVRDDTSSNKSKERNNNIPRSRSKDSGSHSRSDSASSSNSSCNVVVKSSPLKDTKKDVIKKSNEFLPRPQKYDKINLVKNKKESQESGLSSTASTLSSEEENDKKKLNARHTMPIKMKHDDCQNLHLTNNKHLKRVTSVPIDTLPPPPPPPPPANQENNNNSEDENAEEVEIVEEPTIKPSEVVKGMCRSMSAICKLNVFNRKSISFIFLTRFIN